MIKSVKAKVSNVTYRWRFLSDKRRERWRTVTGLILDDSARRFYSYEWEQYHTLLSSSSPPPRKRLHGAHKGDHWSLKFVRVDSTSVGNIAPANCTRQFENKLDKHFWIKFKSLLRRSQKLQRILWRTTKIIEPNDGIRQREKEKRCGGEKKQEGKKGKSGIFIGGVKLMVSF